MDSITKNWACVTGATSGIGKAFAREFAKQGYHLILAGRKTDRLDSLSERLRREYNILAEAENGDLSDRPVIEELAVKLSKKKNMRILVNNAGFGGGHYFDQEDFSTHEDMLYVHELAMLRLTYAVLPQMISASKGIIINLSSTAAFTPRPLNAVYAAGKSMVKHFSESLFLELQGTGVYVQALCPGITRTEFHERMGMNTERIYSKKGMIKAMDPEDVVNISLKYARKNKAVCVPGFYNKMVQLGLKGIPKSWIYTFAKKSQMLTRRD
jgi:uncharacterized protein